ncbi:hypothetical protein C8R47DRAFT_1207238 [Mycena vitilis]|nr:hypothetical protein C8R47DRAFT_1207238 [Mycena vitilis]
MSFHTWIPFEQFEDLALEESIVRGVINQTFAPTREHTSHDGAGVFIYKNCNDEVLSNESHSGFFTEYHPLMYGEVVNVTPYDGGLDVKFTCPVALSALERATYLKQVKILRNIIEVELRQDGGQVVDSWFGGNTSASAADNTFMAYSEGSADWKVTFQLVGMWVQVVRLDRETKHGTCKTYRLMAEYFVVLKDVYT